VSRLARTIAHASGPIPVVTGAFVNALGIARGFAQLHKRTIIVAEEPSVAGRSRHCCFWRCPDPRADEPAFIASLVALGKRLGPKRGFLLCTNDQSLVAIGRAMSQLEPYYVMPMPAWPVLRACYEKADMLRAAMRCGVAVPQSWFLINAAEMILRADEFAYPCVVKPTKTVGFMEAVGVKSCTSVLGNRSELVVFGEAIQKSAAADVGLLAQELVPGGAEALYTLSAYVNRESEIIAYSTGHKIRQTPPTAGTITSGRVTLVRELLEPSQRLVRELGFHGVCNIEFKHDHRDGRYKLIEINPRSGMWNYSATATGTNLFRHAYADAVNGPVAPVAPSDKEAVWIYFGDIIGFWRNKQGNLLDWWRPLHGRKVPAVFSFTDPLPSVGAALDLARSVARRRGRRR
jgi:D-aspartate ligase